jgi:hypothetical protein
MAADIRRTRVILWGLGALGSVVASVVEASPRLTIVGAVDHAADKCGRRLAEVLPGIHSQVVVARSLGECWKTVLEPPDVVLHMTESVLDRIEGQLLDALRRGANVVTASEAMFYPQLRFPEVASRLDSAARAQSVTIIGTGINPGFSFDSFPLLLSRLTADISRIEARRVVNVSGIGPHDIDHAGFGLEPEEFDRGIAAGRIHGHIGLPESIALVAERIGVVIDRIEETWQAHIGSEPVAATIGVIQPGRVIGITQQGRGFDGARERIRMDLIMHYEPTRFGQIEQEEIMIVGRHTVRAVIQPPCVSTSGGACMIVNAIADVVAAPPGLRTAVDLPLSTPPRNTFTLALDPSRWSQPTVTYLRQVPLA